MATEEQISANRENAQLSTGPKTEEGRVVSRFNALKHGLTGNAVSKFDEGLIDFEEFKSALNDELKPVGLIEDILVERISINYLRLLRVSKIEKSVFESIAEPYQVRKKYRDPESGRKYEADSEIYLKELSEWEIQRNNACLMEISVGGIPDKPRPPVEPEFEMTVTGTRRAVYPADLKELVEVLGRYHIEAENHFYKAIRQFYGMRKAQEE